MDDIRPEIQQALADMNWEDRLEKARTQRKAVLEGRIVEDEAHRLRQGPPTVTSVEEVEKLRFGSDAETDTPVGPSRGQHPAVWRPAVQFGLASCVLIGIVLGGMVVGRQVWNGAPVAPFAVGEGPAVFSADDTAFETGPAEAVPTQRPSATEALVQGPEAQNAEAPVVLSEIGGEIASPASIAAPDALGLARASTRPSFKLAALFGPRRDVVPDVGSPPQSAARQMAALGPSDAPALGEPAAPSLSADLAATEAGLGSSGVFGANRASGPAPGTPFGVSSPLPSLDPPDPFGVRLSFTDPERPEHLAALPWVPAVVAPVSAAAISLASLDDSQPDETAPEGIARVPAAGVMPGVDPVPPARMIPGAEAKSVFVFAAATTGEDIVTSVEGVAEGLNLPVRAVNRVGYGISQDQVRFYDTASAAAAQRLAAEIGAVPRDFTGSGLNPPEGTIEIYLAGEAAEAPPPPPTATAPAPVRRPQVSEAQRLRNSVLSRLRNGVSR